MATIIVLGSSLVEGVNDVLECGLECSSYLNRHQLRGVK